MQSLSRREEKPRGGDKRVFCFRATADSSTLHVGLKGMSAPTNRRPPLISNTGAAEGRRVKQATNATEARRKRMKSRGKSTVILRDSEETAKLHADWPVLFSGSDKKVTICERLDKQDMTACLVATREPTWQMTR